MDIAFCCSLKMNAPPTTAINTAPITVFAAMRVDMFSDLTDGLRSLNFGRRIANLPSNAMPASPLTFALISTIAAIW
ncbi:hypothetical protein [Cucumibacter marinus]|uniref:hypothetical protein n=1 Tax=Cucumibacter marinus TaxID=1121252 RepID=UPI0012DD18EF|nr:hypothetical protein [Cucumibacter marinus]